MVAAPFRQQLELSRIFDAFDEYVEAQVVSEPYDGLHHDLIPLAVNDVGDEDAIDLQHVDRQTYQIGQ